MYQIHTICIKLLQHISKQYIIPKNILALCLVNSDFEGFCKVYLFLISFKLNFSSRNGLFGQEAPFLGQPIIDSCQLPLWPFLLGGSKSSRCLTSYGGVDRPASDGSQSWHHATGCPVSDLSGRCATYLLRHHSKAWSSPCSLRAITEHRVHWPGRAVPPGITLGLALMTNVMLSQLSCKNLLTVQECKSWHEIQLRSSFLSPWGESSMSSGLAEVGRGIWHPSDARKSDQIMSRLQETD